RLLRADHRCVVYDVKPEARAALEKEGAVAADSLASLVEQLAPPRPVWLMLPAALVDEQITQLAPLLSSGDLIIDGGNSHYPDDIRRAAELSAQGLHYVDVGTSGGVRGLERGYCLMIGGEDQPVDLLDPIFAALAPGLDAGPRTHGRHGAPSRAELGYFHCGPAGSGHFVKMVHNGIEYGLMASYAEGFNILRHANLGMQERSADAETTPLKQPDLYRYDLNLAEIAEVWRRGSVIASWLLDLTAQALHHDPKLAGFSGRVSDSGEGRWTLAAAVDEGVPAPVLSAALFQRFSSRDGAEFADQLLSAMRYQFGGHVEKGPGHHP
ncbi:MAG TPA: decarboxylating 6-phosphogluconate dehydrogenase, partial [Gemmatimonadales bacterium]|nr:decarboxylating 6-phosphogluconate dehydrogenase [Gemmatimonadales bacterium]